jgi:opacity protein-like surface antigen
MRRSVLFAAGVMMAATTGTALASNQGYYFSGLAGASLLPALGYHDSLGLNTHADFDTGYLYGGAVGYDTGDGWRVELDSLFQNTEVNHFGGMSAPGHVWSTGLMANATYDLTQNTKFTPYVGAGLGFEDVGGRVNGMSGDQWKPAYQFEAGLRDDLSANLSAFTEYRFTQSEATRLAEPGAMANLNYSDHALMVGLTYHFGQD